MNYELEEKIRKEFKFYKGYYGSGMPFDCGDGWYDILYELSKGIQELIDDGIEDPNFSVYDVKEKYGTLRYYHSGASEETDKLVDIAEEKSSKTCELCGEPGEIRNNGNWLTTLCDTCQERNLIRLGEMFKPQKGVERPDKDKNA